MPRDRSYHVAVSGSQSITVTNGVAVTLTVPGSASKAFITVETAQVRFWVDTTAPTTTLGHIADDGSVLYLDEQTEMINFQAIATTGTNATLRVTYYK